MRIFNDRGDANSRNKSATPINHYEPRKILNHQLSANNLPLKGQNDRRNSLYRGTIDWQVPIDLGQSNLNPSNSLVLRNSYNGMPQRNLENSFNMVSIKSLKDVDIANSPSYVKKRAQADENDQLLKSITPTYTLEEEIERKDPNLSLMPSKSSLMRSEGEFLKKRQKPNFKHPSVEFNEMPKVVEVENWKLFNVDTAKTREMVKEETNNKNCKIF
jgi:hypothetical protein